MRRIAVFLLVVAFVTCGSVYTQERVNTGPANKISEKVLGELKKATGWYFDKSHGKWGSESNLIPKSLEDETEGDYSMGYDNFYFYELREIKLKDKDETFILFLKQHKVGKYQYPNIKEGWNFTPDYHLWIFPKKELDKFVKVKDTKKNLVVIDAIHYEKEFGGWDIDKLQGVILKSGLHPAKLCVHIFPFKEKKLVQFLIFGKKGKRLVGSPTYGMYLSDVENETVFGKYYFETDYASFTKLFNIDSADYENDEAQYKFHQN